MSITPDKNLPTVIAFLTEFLADPLEEGRKQSLISVLYYRYLPDRRLFPSFIGDTEREELIENVAQRLVNGSKIPRALAGAPQNLFISKLDALFHRHLKLRIREALKPNSRTRRTVSTEVFDLEAAQFFYSSQDEDEFHLLCRELGSLLKKAKISTDDRRIFLDHCKSISMRELSVRYGRSVRSIRRSIQLCLAALPCESGIISDRFSELLFAGDGTQKSGAADKQKRPVAPLFGA